MPFDVREFPGASARDRAASRYNRRLVAGWLFAVAGMILIMIGLGGATRLTGSGLSIMEWAPIMGALPPLGDAEWNRLFDLYRKIPQYGLVNEGFGLDGFKRIFWLEWTHRFWGRLIGLAFIVPLLWFGLTKRLDRRLLPAMAVLFVLGGLQGGVGWFMVRSGFLADSTAVSAYRLVVHLALALLLYGAIVWTGLSVLRQPTAPIAAARKMTLLAGTVCALVSLTILAGGFVAGLHAGLQYNTFPLMDGRLIPAGYADLHPFLLNLTENVAAVQFDHRLLATATLLAVAVTLTVGSRAPLGRSGRLWLYALAGAALAQYVIGIATLLWVVPVALGTAHQIGATLLLTASLGLLHAHWPDRAPVV
jgi:cytochrome c oxidase assembly protein subunit 15